MKNKNFDENGLKLHKKIQKRHWAGLIAFLFLSILLVKNNATDFMASVIPTKQADPFNGTVAPVQTVPKWTALKSDEYKLAFSEIPADKMIPIPKYDPAVLATLNETLGWKSESDLMARNTKITFSTAYMGTYKLDGLEYTGSHLAVDIKVPTGTPVFAIANGVAVKVTDQNTGFGKHIVIKHENVPSMDDANKKTTYYSSYSHMSQLNVAEGSVVSKGQIIGYSGRTGTATTPHIHFQIDNSDAPWHPYWPFTYAEANAAGLDFWSAINSGLNADKGKKTTINPMIYVQKYANWSDTQGTAQTTTAINTATVSTTPVVTTQTTTADSPTSDIHPSANTTEVTVTPPPPPVTTTTIASPTVNVNSSGALAFRVLSDNGFVKEVSKEITVQAVDGYGNPARNYVPTGNVSVQVVSGNAEVPAYITANEFEEGQAKFFITPKSDNNILIKVTDRNISGESAVMVTSAFSDMGPNSEHYEAIVFLKNHHIIEGYPDGSFKPDNAVSRVEALKFILEGAQENLISGAELPFKDTRGVEWFSDYVATGFNKNIVKGYPDSTFKPAQSVNRVEFIKMLVLAMGITVNKNVTADPYRDVPRDAWFATYVKYATDANLIDVNGEYFYPETPMSRAEVAEMMYRIIMIKMTGRTSYVNGIKVSEQEAQKYFG